MPTSLENDTHVQDRGPEGETARMNPVLDLIGKAASVWPYETITGRILRLPLRALPKSVTVPILSGPARGMKWIIGAGVVDFWLGTYERKKVELFSRYAKPGQTFYDIGANVGFYSLIAVRALGPTGRVVAFEPSPRNIGFLQQHFTLNHATNARILNLAVSDAEGVTRFFEGNDPRVSKMTAAGDITVRTTLLDRLGGEIPPPDLIEMDIEGAEYAALRGAEQLLRKHGPVIFLSTHGQDVHRACCEFLRSLGYKLNAIGTTPVEKTDELYCVKEQ